MNQRIKLSLKKNDQTINLIKWMISLDLNLDVLETDKTFEISSENNQEPNP